MRYLFVTLSILAIWIATILAIFFFQTNSILFPIIALIMTLALFVIGFKNK